MKHERQDLKIRTKNFALRVMRLVGALPERDQVCRVIGNQVLRSGTSIGANYREASRARSTREFVAKIGDCLKEAAETEYWLELLVEGDRIPEAKLDSLLQETRELIAILTTIDKNAKRADTDQKRASTAFSAFSP